VAAIAATVLLVVVVIVFGAVVGCCVLLAVAAIAAAAAIIAVAALLLRPAALRSRAVLSMCPGFWPCIMHPNVMWNVLVSWQGVRVDGGEWQQQ
jgi:hypothetical protein